MNTAGQRITDFRLSDNSDHSTFLIGPFKHISHAIFYELFSHRTPY